MNTQALRESKLEYTIIICLSILLPWQSYTIYQTNVGLADPIVVLIAVLTLLGVIQPSLLTSLTRGLSLFLIIILLSFVFNLFLLSGRVNITLGLYGITKLLGSVSYFAALVILLKQEPEQRMMIFVYLSAITGVLISIETTIGVFSGVYRVSGSFANPNLYADYLIYTIFMLLLIMERYLSEYKYKNTLLISSFLLPVVISLLGTQSRSGVGAFIIGLITLIILRLRSLRSLLATFLSLVSAAVLILYQLSFGITNRFKALLSGDATGGRLDRWSKSTDILSNYPIFGVGWGQHSQYFNTANLHNTVIEVFIESGIFGGVAFLLLLVFIFRRGVQISMIKNHEYTAYFVAFFASSIANSVFHNTLNFRTFWVIIGLIGGAEIVLYREIFSKGSRS